MHTARRTGEHQSIGPELLAHELGPPPPEVSALQEQYAALPPGAPVRLRKRTSNLFRDRRRGSHAELDASAFATVRNVDPEARTAEVGGLTTYEDLVDA